LLSRVVGGVAIGRESATAGRACSVAGDVFWTRAGVLLGGAGAARGLSTRGFGSAAGASAAGGAVVAAGAGRVGVSVMTPSDCSTSDCSTPPVATSAAGAVGGAALLDGRLARNAPAAPTVIH